MSSKPLSSRVSFVLVGLGANLGDREATLQKAVDALRGTPGVLVRSVSKWHATEPVGGPPNQPEFLNGAAMLETTLAARELLDRLLEIETSLGRERREHWGPRTIDLDLLLYDDLILGLPDLVVPHPRMLERAFVLKPAAEIAGDLVHPVARRTIQELWNNFPKK